ncbi:MAG: DNA repair protein RecN [Clostridia bacterium]|nr:DNA repair protein RecN [Clostridia bacterium]
MLSNIDIKNVAVIEKLSFAPGEAMTVLTGETGAGKSIIIDSVNLILGSRTNKDIVRYGEPKAVVSACFDCDGEIFNILEENGIDTDDSTVIVTREITSEGKSVARVNGTMVTATFLRDISPYLINIHGQHDNQSLLNRARHIDYLDEFSKVTDELEEYRCLYNELGGLRKELESLSCNEQERLSRIDLLKYQTEELSKAQLRIGELDELVEEEKLISNSEKISGAVMSALDIMYQSDNCAYDRLNSAIASLSQIGEFNSDIADIYQKLSEASYIIEDCAHELRAFSDKIEFDEQRLDEVNERLDLIKRLTRKYQRDEKGCIEYLKASISELEALQNSDERTQELQEKIEKQYKKVKEAGKKLTKKRSEAAKLLSAQIEEHLHELDMEKAVFCVKIEEKHECSSSGFDEVEFMFCANPGQPLKPLAQIASGGELSRVMLSMKSVLSDADSADTLIFDEIDTGVSGNAAQKIAKKLALLGKKKQVICISHQPQLAAAANNHFKIEKRVSDGVTSTSIRLLGENDRVEELARMIDGNEITEVAINHASEMIKRGY